MLIEKFSLSHASSCRIQSSGFTEIFVIKQQPHQEVPNMASQHSRSTKTKMPSKKTKAQKTAPIGRAPDFKVAKASAKKQRHKSKATKVQIEKLNRDLGGISSVQQELAKTPEKEILTLDPESLRDGLKKDKKTRLESKQAEQDLQTQLEIMTGFSL